MLKQKNTPVGTYNTHIFSTKWTTILILRFRLLSWSVPVPHCLWRHNKDNHFLYWDLVIDHDRKHLPVLFNLAPRQKRFQECSIKWHLCHEITCLSHKIYFYWCLRVNKVNDIQASDSCTSNARFWMWCIHRAAHILSSIQGCCARSKPTKKATKCPHNIWGGLKKKKRQCQYQNDVMMVHFYA